VIVFFDDPVSWCGGKITVVTTEFFSVNFYDGDTATYTIDELLDEDGIRVTSNLAQPRIVQLVQ
jgi:hypothetical protein